MPKAVNEREMWILLRKISTNEEYDDFFGGEYDKLRAHPQVRNLIVKVDGFSFLCDSYFTRDDGKQFNLGLWYVHVNVSAVLRHNDSDILRVTLLSTGRKDGVKANFYGGERGFCFGPRR